MTYLIPLFLILFSFNSLMASSSCVDFLKPTNSVWDRPRIDALKKDLIKLRQGLPAKKWSKYDTENSARFHASWELTLDKMQFTAEVVFATSTAANAEVKIKNVHTTGDIVIFAYAGGGDAIVTLENVSARNILIMAQGNGAVNIDYSGRIEVQGKIIELVPRTHRYVSRVKENSSVMMHRNEFANKAYSMNRNEYIKEAHAIINDSYSFGKAHREFSNYERAQREALLKLYLNERP